MSLKERVARAMEHKGCEIPELATACRIKAPSVHGWVNGTSNSMKAAPAIRAAEYLGVRALWLAVGEGEMLDVRTDQSKDSRLHDIVIAWRLLDEGTKEQWSHWARVKTEES